MPKQSRRKNRSIECEVINLSGGPTAKGCEAEYFEMPCSGKFGLKVYDSWVEAEEAWQRQKKAHSLGMAPGVGKMLIVKHKRYWNSRNAVTRFGYETEIAEPISRGWYNKIWKEQHQDLERRLLDSGLAGGDFGPKNCGIIDGRVVQVDFGPCSYYDKRIF